MRRFLPGRQVHELHERLTGEELGGATLAKAARIARARTDQEIEIGLARAGHGPPSVCFSACATCARHLHAMRDRAARECA
jgi:hypothetical protein